MKILFRAMLVALTVSSWHCGLAVAAEPELGRGDSSLRFHCSASPCISICFLIWSFKSKVNDLERKPLQAIIFFALSNRQLKGNPGPIPEIFSFLRTTVI